MRRDVFWQCEETANEARNITARVPWTIDSLTSWKQPAAAGTDCMLRNMSRNGGGLREKSKEFVQRKLLEKIPETILWQQVCEELFQRDYNTIDDEIRRFLRK